MADLQCAACEAPLVACIRLSGDAGTSFIQVRQILVNLGYKDEVIARSLSVEKGHVQLTAKGRLLAGLTQRLDAAELPYQCLSPQAAIDAAAPKSKGRAGLIAAAVLLVLGGLAAGWWVAQKSAAPPAVAGLDAPATGDAGLSDATAVGAADEVSDAGTGDASSGRTPTSVAGKKPREIDEETIKKAFRAAVKVQTDDTVGAGIIVSDMALVLTNAHVVGTAKTVTVHLWDGRAVDGEVVDRRPQVDLALIKFEPSEGQTFEVAQLRRGVSMDLQAPVFFIGAPAGLGHSIRRGRIAAGLRWVGGLPCLQLDIPIYGGDSGSGIFDHEGKVVGIATLKAGGVDGVGFAVLAEMATEGPAILTRYFGHKARSGRLDQFMESEENKAARRQTGADPRLLASLVGTSTPHHHYERKARRCPTRAKRGTGLCMRDVVVDVIYDGPGRPPAAFTAHFTGAGGSEKAMDAPASMTVEVDEWKKLRRGYVSAALLKQFFKAREAYTSSRITQVRIPGHHLYWMFKRNKMIGRTFLLKGKGAATPIMRVPSPKR
jgi:S1-C subfamily serine protease